MPESDRQVAPSVSSLRWRCRRGMVELDWMLERYLQRVESQGNNANDLNQLATLLAEEDDHLWDWLSGRVAPPAQYKDLVQRIRRR